MVDSANKAPIQFPGQKATEEFKSTLSTRKSGFLRLEGPKSESVISTDQVFLLEDEGQFCLAVKNPLYLPIQPPLHDLQIQDLRSPKFYYNTNLASELAQQDSNRFVYELRESAFFDLSRSEAFMESIQKNVFIYEPEEGITTLPNGKVAFSLSPGLLLSQVQKACQDTLRRSSIDPDQPINEAYLIELHQNAADYLKRVAELQISKQKAASPHELFNLENAHAQSSSNDPENPLIFYKSATHPSGARVLKPILVLPKNLQEKVRSQREGNIFAHVLGRFEAGTSVDQMLASLDEGTPLGDALRKLLSKNENIAKDIDESAARYRSQLEEKPAHVRMKDEIHLNQLLQSKDIALVSRDDLMVDTSQKGQSAAFVSLEGSVRLASSKTREQQGTQIQEKIDDQRRLNYDGNLTIKAGKNIETEAVKIIADSGIFEAKGSVIDQPIALEYQNESHSENRSEQRRTIKNQTSSFHFTQGFKVEGNQILFVGTEAQADKLSLDATKQIQVLGVHDEEDILETREEETGAWFWKGKKTETSHNFSVNFVEAHLKSNQPIQIKSKEVTLQAPKLESSETQIEGKTVKFKLGKNLKKSSRIQSSKNAFWISQDVDKRNDEFFTQLETLGPIKIKATHIELEKVKTRTLDYIERLEFDPEKVQQIEHLLNELHEHTHDSISAPGPALIAAVAIAASIATGGAGGAAVAGLGLQAAGGLIASATGAAISSLSAQVATQLTLSILAQQSPGDILGKIIHTDTLKNMVTASISAGALYEVGGLQNAAGTCKVMRNLENAAVEAGVGMGSNLAFGQNNLDDALASGGVQFVSQAAGSSIAGEIGDYFKDKHSIWDRCLHKAAHGIAAGGIAAGAAAMTDQDVGAAAAGAMTAEVVSDFLTLSFNEEVYAEVQNKQAELGRELTVKEKETLSDSKIKSIRTIATISGAVSGLFASGAQGMSTGQSSASNAIANNWIETVAAGLATAYLAYEWERSNVVTDDAIVPDPLGETVLLTGAQRLKPVIYQAGKRCLQVAQESKIIGNEVGTIGESAVDSAASLAHTNPDLGRKLDYVLGKATGSAHNVERSRDMLGQMERIGFSESQGTRTYLADHLKKA